LYKSLGSMMVKKTAKSRHYILQYLANLTYPWRGGINKIQETSRFYSTISLYLELHCGIDTFWGWNYTSTPGCWEGSLKNVMEALWWKWNWKWGQKSHKDNGEWFFLVQHQIYWSIMARELRQCTGIIVLGWRTSVSKVKFVVTDRQILRRILAK
jgi:hypothetical protein